MFKAKKIRQLLINAMLTIICLPSAIFWLLFITCSFSFVNLMDILSWLFISYSEADIIAQGSFLGMAGKAVIFITGFIVLVSVVIIYLEGDKDVQ